MQNSFYSESQLLWWVVEYISHSIARFFKYLHIGRIICNRQNQLLSSVATKKYGANLNSIVETPSKIEIININHQSIDLKPRNSWFTGLLASINLNDVRHGDMQVHLSRRTESSRDQ